MSAAPQPTLPAFDGVAMFWGTSTSGDGLKKLFMSPDAEAIARRAVAALDPTAAAAPPLASGLPRGAARDPLEGVDLSGGGHIDEVTGKFVRPAPPTLRAVLSTSIVLPRVEGMPDPRDPDALMAGGAGADAAADAVTAALTAPTGPPGSYFDVLRALVAAVRAELLAPLNAPPRPLFALPPEEDVGPAFPASVRAEDPAYFEEKASGRAQLAREDRERAAALRRAHLAADDDVVYAFDRRAPQKRSRADGIAPAAGARRGAARARGGRARAGAAAGAAGGVGGAGSLITVSESTGGAGGGAASVVDGGHSVLSFTLSESVGGSGASGAGGGGGGGGTGGGGESVGGRLSHSVLDAGARALQKLGLPPELNDPAYRSAAARGIVAAQGRRELAAGAQAAGPAAASSHHRFAPTSVRDASGNEAAGTSAGPRVGFPRLYRDPPLPADAPVDALRWSEQSAVAAEHRRARCQHVLALLAAEVARETRRQTHLRLCAAKFAASESRKADPAGDWASFLTGLPDVAPGAAADAARGARAGRGGRAAPALARGGRDPGADAPGEPLRFAGKGSVALRSGATLFSATDFAWERYAMAQDRAETADSLMRVLEDYRLLPVSVAAGYLRSTLENVDDTFGEWIGARAAAAGRELTADERAAAVADMNERVEREGAEEEEDEEGGSRRSGASARRARAAVAANPLAAPLSRGGSARARAGGAGGAAAAAGGLPPRAPVLPSPAFQRLGGAVAYDELSDVQEVARFGASTARARRRAAADVLAAEAAKEAARLAEFGPGRDAVGADGAAGAPARARTLDDLDDPALVSGLSAFNVRPFAAREAAREALARTLPDPELYAGYGDGIVAGDDDVGDGEADGGGAAAKSAGGRRAKGGATPSTARSSASGASSSGRRGAGSRSSARVGLPPERAPLAGVPEGAGGPEEEEEEVEGGSIDAAEGAADDAAAMAAAVAAAAATAAANANEPPVGQLTRKEAPLLLQPPAYGGRLGRAGAAAVSLGRPRGGGAAGGGAAAARGARRAAAAAAAEPFNPGLASARAAFGDALDNPGFREVAMALTEFRPNPLGGRPDWHAAVLKHVPLDQIRESGDLKFGMVKRMAKEPPSRYSHLVGRYLRADDLRAQYVAERIYKSHALGIRRDGDEPGAGAGAGGGTGGGGHGHGGGAHGGGAHGGGGSGSGGGS